MQKRNILRQTKCFWDDRKNHGKLLSKKRVRVKAGIPPPIAKKTVCRVLWRLNKLKWTHFWRKGILTKMTWNGEKVYCKLAITKYEIIEKPVVIERVEVNLLKSAQY